MSYFQIFQLPPKNQPNVWQVNGDGPPLWSLDQNKMEMDGGCEELFCLGMDEYVHSALLYSSYSLYICAIVTTSGFMSNIFFLIRGIPRLPAALKGDLFISCDFN